ncbi:MAG: 50S ribosomal protein L31 [Candidatus Peribacteraceae bacterium]|jgi:large subunit ribosomal protein L31|nr:50S ribosomal protein L31 [Candidatus Peribacteraceae bacterium]
MKAGIHSEIHQKAKITCSSCDSVFEIPTTVAEMTVEKCRNCHPVYTGKEQQAATGGRVERFRKRMAAQKKK